MDSSLAQAGTSLTEMDIGVSIEYFLPFPRLIQYYHSLEAVRFLTPQPVLVSGQAISD